MQKIKISYLVTCSSEVETLDRLLDRIRSLADKEDEIVILTDKEKIENNKETWNVVDKYLKLGVEAPQISHYSHHLGNNYSAHKNYGVSFCHCGDYIFQIDGDELPTEVLLLNVKDIIQFNPGIELFWIPRINDFRGVTEKHAKQWGWNLTESPTYKRPIVNWPDSQGRLFLNRPDRIKWVGRLHERIEGVTDFVYLPSDEDLALYHDKTIEKQMETNLRYNRDFTLEENIGYDLPK